MKIVLALGTALVILVAAFVVLPRALLHVSGNDDAKATRTALAGQRHPVTGAGASVTPAVRKIESFASMQSRAGFAPLTPRALPAGYQPVEQYLYSDAPAEVLLTYERPGSLFIVIDEKRIDANLPNFLRPDRPPFPDRTPLPGVTPSTFRGRLPRVDLGGTPAVYVQDVNGGGARAYGNALALPVRANTQPHRLFFFRGDLQIVVEADQTDVPQAELIRVAAGLH